MVEDAMAQAPTQDLDFSGSLPQEASRVLVVNSSENWDRILQEANSQGAFVIVHFAADWCAPCKFMEPVFDDLSRKYTQAVFVQVDMDEMQDLSSKLGVKAMPTFLFIKEETPVDKIVGANKDELERRLEELVLKGSDIC